MNKGLEAYTELLDIIEVPVKSHLLNTNDKETLEKYRVLRTDIEIELKRLEKQDEILRIIKEKKVDILLLMSSGTLGFYNTYRPLGTKDLLDKEFDLLKEIIC